jgi:ubiquinol-cytochrome c reductase cytochrome c1 subunit
VKGVKNFLFATLVFFTAPSAVLAASDSLVALFPFQVERDAASLQRGAKYYMNFCAGCHSLQYMRYNRLAKDIGITDNNGKVLTDLVEDNLIFTDNKIHDTVTIAMQKKDAEEWFGVAPPDLTLSARVRGPRWIYTYLRTFYRDDARPWGTNNLAFPMTGMPNVLLAMEGERLPVYRTNASDVQILDHLTPAQGGKLSTMQFDQMVTDIVNFLAYVAEPMQEEQQRLGFWVIGFLLIFFIVAYFLKKEYWKDVK